MLKKLLTNHNIKTIIHGGESLDIPYIFNNLLTTAKEQDDFCVNLYDTKFLCEYYNLEKNKTENRCKIYYLLKQMKIVNKKQFNYLLKNEKKMGPIYNIRINVKNMSKALINYCTYDVLYLPELYKSFPNTNYYQKIIPEITCIHYILKQTDFFNMNFEKISKFNNTFIKINDTTINLIDLYQFMYFWIKTNKISFVLDINYFRKFFEIIIKTIVYSNTINNYIVYIRKDQPNQNNIKSLKHVLKRINNFKHTISFLNKIEKEITKEL